MADVSRAGAFSTVPAGEAEEIKRVIVEAAQQVAQDDGTFKRAKLVFTESDERCGLTAELDGVKREGVPLQLDLEQLEDAKTSAGARAQLKEALRLYFRDRKSTRLNSSHSQISYAVFCLKKKITREMPLKTRS